LSFFIAYGFIVKNGLLWHLFLKKMNKSFYGINTWNTLGEAYTILFKIYVFLIFFQFKTFSLCFLLLIDSKVAVNPEFMDEVKIDGFRIAYQRRGQGSPLVLLHGAFSDSRAWRRQLEELSDEFTVVAWDAPGCGQSSDPPVDFGLSDYADCLSKLIDILDLKHPHLLGLSFGGGLALEFYGRYPKVSKSLILASAYAGWAGSLPPEEVESRLRRVMKEIDLPPSQWVRGYLPSLFTASVSQEVVDEAVAMMLDTKPHGLRTMLHAFAKADLRNVLPLIIVPTLLLYGDADQRSPLNVANDLHSKISTSKLVVMHGVGHESNMEAPETFNNEVRQFLRTQPLYS
jgi:pimeloyl-ACP methyl ester carboxylesterase